MNLRDTLAIMAGGPGSGCHGPNCGRPKGSGDSEPQRKEETPVEKPKKSWKSEHKDFGKAGSKKVAGVFVNGSAMAHIYKTLLNGQELKVADLQKSLTDQGLEVNLMSRLRSFHIIGGEVNSWSLVFDKYSGTVKMITKNVGVEHNAEQVDQKVYNAAKAAVAKLIDNKTGLSTTISEGAIKEYLHSVGLKDSKWFDKCISSWSGSAQGMSALYLKKVAANYYGRPWSAEYISGSDPTKNKDFQNDPNFKALHEQSIAMKTLAGEYIRAAGIKEIYRGVHGSLGSEIISKVQKAIAQGKDEIEIPMNSLTGFSLSKAKANDFGAGTHDSGVTLKHKVDPDNVWALHDAMPHLFTYHSEKEVLVGFKEPVLKFKLSDIRIGKSVSGFTNGF